MEDKQQKILEARKRLAQKYGKQGSRVGGAGVPRRKKRVNRKTGGTDNKLKNLLKKFKAEPIPEIAEVNMFTDNDTVMTFKAPEVHGSFQHQVFVVTGDHQERNLTDCFAEVMNQLGPEQLERLKNLKTGNQPAETIQEDAEGEDEEAPQLEA
eukprot:NODE_5905_length_544_cov_52.446465_g5158_i0.p1 GENE.NODE_5905_length_544_cov_52.446465_g5158_i0~~NODE_5905_length_544_cov_52.446465_g5158_i0.p1  ORF type:complete len:167 (-),score=14.90 NODE_5905_length_544_cov_52.446465_g5158_i0:42-500(-)